MPLIRHTYLTFFGRCRRFGPRVRGRKEGGRTRYPQGYVGFVILFFVQSLWMSDVVRERTHTHRNISLRRQNQPLPRPSSTNPHTHLAAAKNPPRKGITGWTIISHMSEVCLSPYIYLLKHPLPEVKLLLCATRSVWVSSSFRDAGNNECFTFFFSLCYGVSQSSLLLQAHSLPASPGSMGLGVHMYMLMLFLLTKNNHWHSFKRWCGNANRLVRRVNLNKLDKKAVSSYTNWLRQTARNCII